MRNLISKAAYLSIAVLLLAQAPGRADIIVQTGYVLAQQVNPGGSSGAGNSMSDSDALRASVTDAGSISLANASVAASGGLFGSGLDLQLRTFASGSARSYSNYETGEGSVSQFLGSAYAGWRDYFTVSGGPDLPLATSVTFVVGIGGSLSAEGDAAATSYATLSDLTLGNHVEKNGDASGTLALSIYLDSTGLGGFAMSLESDASGVGNPLPPPGGTLFASATSDFSHTLIIRSILMADAGGSLVTPESLGYRLAFDSGMRSPNLRAVPEPSSVVLTVLGAIAIGGWGWRKRRGNGPTGA